jgi:hypothetical protein
VEDLLGLSDMPPNHLDQGRAARQQDGCNILDVVGKPEFLEDRLPTAPFSVI